jgi:hypothetical protein
MNPFLYILMRNDLPSMNVGKAMAQASHASNQAVWEAMGLQGENAQPQIDLVRAWQQECKGFGTAIILSANIGEITVEMDAFDDDPAAVCGLVTDPTYSYKTHTDTADLIPMTVDTADRIHGKNGMTKLFRNEITCGYVLLDKEVFTGGVNKALNLWK